MLICVVAGVIRAYQDSCTGSFERSSQPVIESYAQAITNGDSSQVENSWHHDPFFETETGWSVVCLTKVLGIQFEITSIEYGEEIRTNDGRLTLDVSVSATCLASNVHHEVQITLNAAVQNYPWRHWHIIYSTLGGPVAEPWCE